MRRVFMGALAVCLLARQGLGDTPESDTAHRVVQPSVTIEEHH